MQRGSALGGRGNENERSGEVGGWVGVFLADYPVHLTQLCRPTHSHQSGTPYLPEAQSAPVHPPCHSIHPPVHVE